MMARFLKYPSNNKILDYNTHERSSESSTRNSSESSIALTK